MEGRWLGSNPNSKPPASLWSNSAPAVRNTLPWADEQASLEGSALNKLKGLFAWARARLGWAWGGWRTMARDQRHQQMLCHAQQRVRRDDSLFGVLMHWRVAASDSAWRMLTVNEAHTRTNEARTLEVLQQWRGTAYELKHEQLWQQYKWQHWDKPQAQRDLMALMLPLRMQMSACFAAWVDVVVVVRNRFALQVYLRSLQYGLYLWKDKVKIKSRHPIPAAPRVPTPSRQISLMLPESELLQEALTPPQHPQGTSAKYGYTTPPRQCSQHESMSPPRQLAVPLVRFGGMSPSLQASRNSSMSPLEHDSPTQAAPAAALQPAPEQLEAQLNSSDLNTLLKASRLARARESELLLSASPGVSRRSASPGVSRRTASPGVSRRTASPGVSRRSASPGSAKRDKQISLEAPSPMQTMGMMLEVEEQVQAEARLRESRLKEQIEWERAEAGAEARRLKLQQQIAMKLESELTQVAIEKEQMQTTAAELHEQLVWERATITADHQAQLEWERAAAAAQAEQLVSQITKGQTDAACTDALAEVGQRQRQREQATTRLCTMGKLEEFEQAAEAREHQLWQQLRYERMAINSDANSPHQDSASELRPMQSSLKLFSQLLDQDQATDELQSSPDGVTEAIAAPVAQVDPVSLLGTRSLSRSPPGVTSESDAADRAHDLSTLAASARHRELPQLAAAAESLRRKEVNSFARLEQLAGSADTLQQLDQARNGAYRTFSWPGPTSPSHTGSGAAIGAGIRIRESEEQAVAHVQAQNERLQVLQTRVLAAEAETERLRELEERVHAAEAQNERLRDIEQKAIAADKRERDLIQERNELRGANIETKQALDVAISTKVELEEAAAGKVKALQEAASKAEEMERSLASLARRQGLEWDESEKQKVVAEMLAAADQKEQAFRKIAAEKVRLEELAHEKDKLLVAQASAAKKQTDSLHQQLRAASVFSNKDSPTVSASTHGVALSASQGALGSALAVRSIAMDSNQQQLQKLRQQMSRDSTAAKHKLDKQAEEAQRSAALLSDAKKLLEENAAKHSQDLKLKVTSAIEAKQEEFAKSKQEFLQHNAQQSKLLLAAEEENKRVRRDAEARIKTLQQDQQRVQEITAKELEAELERRNAAHRRQLDDQQNEMSEKVTKLELVESRKAKWKQTAMDKNQEAEDARRGLHEATQEKIRLEKEANDKARALEEQHARVAALVQEKEELEKQIAEAPASILEELDLETEVPEEPLWIEDDAVTQCVECLAKFTMLRRKHHCRGCGNIFCDDCSVNKLDCLPWAMGVESRVCAQCFSRFRGLENEKLLKNAIELRKSQSGQWFQGKILLK